MPKSRPGSKNPAWKGGRVTLPNGYVLVLVGTDHHLADNRGYAYEHRVIAEQMIGRRLKAGEVVHHGPLGRSVNTPENIKVIVSHSEHMKREHCDVDRFRKMQSRGAATKRLRMLNQTLPAVVAAIKAILDSESKATMSRCAGIPGYSAVRSHFRHSELIDFAKGTEK